MLLYTEVRSRENTLMDASFCVAKKAASVLPNKRLQISEDFRRHKLHSSPFLFVRYFGSNELLLLLSSGAWGQYRYFCNQIDQIRGGQSAAR